MEKKLCENCQYYLRHYIKRDVHYRVTCCGHCTNKKSGKRNSKPYLACELYAETNRAAEKEAQRKSVTEYLSFISELLSNLTEALKD
jgi:hypothetical protein